VRTRFVAAVLIAFVAVFAAGCGDDENAAATWADGVCSSINDWQTDIEGNLDELRDDPSAISADSVRAAAEDSLESTEAMLDELRELGAPETESGDQARQEVEQLLEALEERLERVRDAAEAAEEGVAELIAVIASVANEVEGASQDARDTVEELRDLEPGGDLEEAFRNEDACESLVEQ
jgi:chromosome segregation ATPase